MQLGWVVLAGLRNGVCLWMSLWYRGFCWQQIRVSGGNLKKTISSLCFGDGWGLLVLGL